MVFVNHQFSQRYSVRQTLHDCIEKTSVSVILHRKSAVVFVLSTKQSVGVLIIHHFKAARVTALG
jgi:hypothetical protein